MTATGASPVRAALAMAIAGAALPAGATGAELYTKHCIACHQAEGEGTPGIAPPLAGVLAKRAPTADGRAFLARLLVFGMSGPIVSQGQRYFGNMPPFGALADDELAGIINHVLARFNASTVELAAADFAAARTPTLAPADVRKLRERVLALTGE